MSVITDDLAQDAPDKLQKYRAGRKNAAMRIGGPGAVAGNDLGARCEPVSSHSDDNPNIEDEIVEKETGSVSDRLQIAQNSIQSLPSIDLLAVYMRRSNGHDRHGLGLGLVA